MLTNTELTDLVTAIGTGAGDKFDISGLRYGKIILLMDADADGHHITTLMLAFFFRHMPELIRKGHVYIAASRRSTASTSARKPSGPATTPTRSRS